MILTAAINAYLERELDAHSWVKDLSEAQLEAALSRLEPKPDLHPSLRLHQKACFLLGVSFPQFCYWLDMGCVDRDTEYLTPTGWEKISSYESGVVGQYDPLTRQVTFVEPLSYVKRPCGEMLHFKTARGVDQMLSGEHNMLVVAQGKKDSKKSHPSKWKHTPVAALPEYVSKSQPNPWFYKVSAGEVASLRGQRHLSVETTFECEGAGFPLPDALLRVQVAVHADGYLPNRSRAIINVKKQRKKDRARRLLADAGIQYKERDGGNGYIAFVFTPPIMTKTYGPEWWACTTAQKKVIADEVGHWDGSFSKAGGVSFFTRSKQCAEFIQFCFSSTRRRAFVTGTPARDGGGKTDYCVHATGQGRTTNLANIMAVEAVPSPDGFKYCFEVPTGYLVLRRNGNVFVTGNTGKTLLSFELLKYWFKVGTVRRAIVLVTSDKAFDTWEKQLERFSVGLPAVSLTGSSKEKWAQLEELKEGLVLVPYPGAVAMVSKRVKGKRGMKLQLDKKLVKKLAYWADGLVLDESTRCGSPSSLTFKLVAQLRKYGEVRYALAGRPFGRDPTMLWAQHYLIDGGETLGETLGLFRAAFFSEQPNRWDPKGYAKDYTFKKAMKPQLSEMIQHRSITYSAEECIDLPAVVPVREVVHLPEEAGAYYERAREDVMEAKGNVREMKNAFLRMRQISSGFVGFTNDETGERAEVELIENPKLERLIELIEDLPETAKAVVFYEYTYSGRKVAAALKERGIENIWLWSGTENAKKELNRFYKQPKVEVAVVNNRIGAYSLDGLQDVANYAFFYESPLSIIDREQAERRLIRQGQKRKVFQYDLVVRGTVDERILDFHQDGRDFFDEVLRKPSLLR